MSNLMVQNLTNIKSGYVCQGWPSVSNQHSSSGHLIRIERHTLWESVFTGFETLSLICSKTLDSIGEGPPNTKGQLCINLLRWHWMRFLLMKVVVFRHIPRTIIIKLNEFEWEWKWWIKTINHHHSTPTFHAGTRCNGLTGDGQTRGLHCLLLLGFPKLDVFLDTNHLMSTALAEFRWLDALPNINNLIRCTRYVFVAPAWVRLLCSPQD